jgi:steroid delta-isomerase-like uncharacterized protein
MCGIFCLALQWSHTQQTSTLKSSGPVSLENTFSEKVVNMHNTGILYSLLSDDFISHHFPKPGNNTKIQFIEAMNNLLTAFPDIKITRKEQFESGDKVFTYAFWEGTHKAQFNGIPATGKKVQVEYMDIWRIKNGQIVENWVMMDILGLLIQLGVIPPPGQ